MACVSTFLLNWVINLIFYVIFHILKFLKLFIYKNLLLWKGIVDWTYLILFGTPTLCFRIIAVLNIEDQSCSWRFDLFLFGWLLSIFKLIWCWSLNSLIILIGSLYLDLLIILIFNGLILIVLFGKWKDSIMIGLSDIILFVFYLLIELLYRRLYRVLYFLNISILFSCIFSITIILS